MPTEEARKLTAILEELSGRTLSAVEVAAALGMNQSRYYREVHAGRLITQNNLATAATNLGIDLPLLRRACGLP